jgi:hypothetical protein
MANLSERGEKMCPASSPRVTELLARWGQGDVGAREALIPLVVYEELRRIAHRQLWRQRVDHTLQSAALVNEAYLRLVHQQSPQWQNRPHFWCRGATNEEHLGGLCPKPPCCQARGRRATNHPRYEDGLAPKRKRASRGPEKRASVSISDGKQRDIWLYDLARGVRTRGIRRQGSTLKILVETL